MTPKMKKENENENEKEIATFFGQISKSIVQIFKTIEAAIFTFPKLIIAVLGEFEILVVILQVFFIGLVWMWFGTFLLHHMEILKFILNVLNDVAIVVSRLFGIFGDTVEESFNILAKIGNVGGNIINDSLHFLHITKKNVVPTIPTIPLTRFPVLNFEGFIKSLDQVHDASTLCEPFSSATYELAFPLRYALNDQVCPVVRYMYGTIIYTPFSWLLSLFYFDANPNDEINANCHDIEAQYICFFLKFGNVLIYIITPLMILSWLWPWVSSFFKSLLKLIGDLFILGLEFIKDTFHLLFHKTDSKRSA
jgi:hypothetical protein